MALVGLVVVAAAVVAAAAAAAAALSSMVVVVAGAGAWSSRSRIGCNMVRLEEYEPTVNCGVHQAPKGTPKPVPAGPEALYPRVRSLRRAADIGRILKL